ncbi:YolD-like family protein [Bacillus sp. FJAT-45350]|uniref:YolD-like family protein n=1 Tax=Bacillus sp. FJAT-45350 TaxID=2011014 RepID=UPI000BB958B6|nr:YolD-like family protein [Bacillus sp. FJAT-45350]
MLRDRGTIKWTAMMLPEHVSLLRELKEKMKRKEKPELDPQKLEEMNETILMAIENKSSVAITYYHQYDFHCLIGTIARIDGVNKRIHIFDKFEESSTLLFNQIIDINFHE